LNFQLQNLLDQCRTIKEVKKSFLNRGDLIFLKTDNSVYKIDVVDKEHYTVSGGWFDKNNLSPAKMKINGCTWGGSAIKSDIIAACGLFLEFGNRLRTSRIQQIIILPKCFEN